MKTVELKSDGSVSSFVENALQIAPFLNAIELGVYENGALIGGAVIDWHNGAPCMLSVAGNQGWATQNVLQQIFSHAYDDMNLALVCGLVDPNNADGVAFASLLGAINEGNSQEHVGNYDLWSMTKEQCNYYDAG